MNRPLRLKTRIIAVRLSYRGKPGPPRSNVIDYLPSGSLIELRGASRVVESGGVTVVYNGDEYAAFEQDVFSNCERA